jgi:membrane protein
VREYILSLAGLLAFAFLLLISMLLSAGAAAMGKFVGGGLSEAVLQTVQFAISFMTTAATFALLFKFMPDTRVAWRDVLIGAIGTAVLFEIGKFGIGLYIGKQGLESTYGASASIVVLLIWVYYSAQILLFGAEFTRARAIQRERPSP